ncbi:MAG: ribosomal protein S18 acetylase RimI-like enzyme, partial [Myxococcota bacterium]
MTDPLDDLVASLVLRPLTPDDYDALVALQRACFPGMAPWSHREYDGQMRYFPQGQLGIIADGRLVASASGLIVSAADYEGWHDWREVSGNGAIANHDPEGDTLYGIEIQVHPDLRGRRLARRLYEARKELCRRMNLARIAIGGRIPGYSAHRDTMSAREFIEAVAAGRMYDPVLTSQLANGFQLEAIIPDYLPTDEDSAGYATSLIWPNLDYVAPRAPRRRRSAVQRVRVGAVQWQMRRVASWDEFVQQAEFFVDSAAERRTDVLVFPELFSLSLLSLIDERRPAEGARALAAYAPQYVTALRDLAMKYAVNVVGGSTLVVEEESGRLLNIAYV